MASAVGDLSDLSHAARAPIWSAPSRVTVRVELTCASKVSEVSFASPRTASSQAPRSGRAESKYVQFPKSTSQLRKPRKKSPFQEPGSHRSSVDIGGNDYKGRRLEVGLAI